ncbi:MAG: hypothetical protein ABWZ82_08650, partial [Candidatus Limnocylindrales bacterium]
GDPSRAVRRLRAHGIATVNIVGMGLDRTTRRQMRRLARLGGGSYFDARDASGLERAITVAVSAPFSVTDGSGRTVATGTVGGSPVQLPPGTYRVIVAAEPQVVFDAVVVSEGKRTVLDLAPDLAP